MEHFTPVPALIGGLLIGASASLLLLASGRIAGVSGIVGGLVGRNRGDHLWRVLFLAGLVAGAGLFRMVSTGPSPTIDSPAPTLVLAGLLVGYGTRLGSGCTSGHGICGMARLSPRSIVATLTFMLFGFVTVFVVRHVVGG